MKRLMIITLAAASAAAFAAPEADAIEQKRVRAEKLLAAYGNACAQVKIYLKLDKNGEPPKHSFRYLCPNCNSYHSESAESYLREGRPAETCAFAVAPDRFLMQDDRFRADWVERIEVVFGGVAYPAKPVRRYLREEALELKTDKPVKGVTPLSFSKRIDFRNDSKGVFFFNAKEGGLAVSGMKPNAAADFTHYADVGKDLAKATGNAIAVNASNEAVTVVFRNLLPVGADEFRPPSEWAGESIEAIERRWDDFESRAKTSFVPLYLHLDDEGNRKDGWSRRYSSYREDSEATDLDLVGLLLPEGDVLAELKLDASKVSEIDKIEAVLADGKRAAMEFVGAFGEQKLAVFRFADGKVPEGLSPLRLNARAPASRFLEAVYALKVSNFGGKLKSGKPHDGRAPDYDDWSLNGDLLFWHPVLSCAMEISSMGIRVSPESLDRQLTLAGCDERRELPFHKMLLEGKLPLTMGGGIGQSRLCMLLLGKAHIGEVQSSIWDAHTHKVFEEAGITLL